MTVIARWSHAVKPDYTKRGDFPAPQVMSDIEDYRSPIDGKPITSRSHRREDLKANECVEYEPTSKFERGFSNPDFAVKRGLPLNETGQAKLEQMNKAGIKPRGWKQT